MFLGQQHEVAKFIQTKNGNKLLYSEGYVYSRNGGNVDESKIYWQCRNKNKKERCPARAVTDGDYVIDQKGVHIHPANILQSDGHQGKSDLFLKTIMNYF